MKVNPNIFKEYDIRGIYPKEINKKVAREIGAVFVRFLGKKKQNIIVGRDLRSSAPKLAKGFTEGAIERGANIIDIGAVTSPMLYYAVSLLRADAGAMITASHNPKQYNGIKMILGNGQPISGEEIKKIIGYKKVQKTKRGTYKKIDISQRYLDEIVRASNKSKINKKIKIAIIDKGTSKLFIPKFIKRFNLSLSKRPDFYASFDLDGDRLIILDKNKKEIRGDIIGTIIGDAITKKKEKIIYDLRCSKAVPEHFRNKGVRTLISKAGNYNVKNLMRKQRAIFSMEITGHYFFKRFNYHGAPFFALLKILEQMSKDSSLKLSEPYIPFKKFYHSGIINLKIKNFAKLVEKLKSDYKNGAQNSLDGLTIEFSNWWFNLHPSKTEPLIRLVIEANSPKLLEQKKKELLKIISA